MAWPRETPTKMGEGVLPRPLRWLVNAAALHRVPQAQSGRTAAGVTRRTCAVNTVASAGSRTGTCSGLQSSWRGPGAGQPSGHNHSRWVDAGGRTASRKARHLHWESFGPGECFCLVVQPCPNTRAPTATEDRLTGSWFQLTPRSWLRNSFPPSVPAYTWSGCCGSQSKATTISSALSP